MNTKIEELWYNIEKKLKDKVGQVVAIEEESGEYVAKRSIDAIEKAQKKHPHRKFFLKRVGVKTAYVVGIIIE